VVVIVLRAVRTTVASLGAAAKGASANDVMPRGI